MKRRSRAGSTKSQGRRVASRTRPSGAEAARTRSPSAANQETEVTRLARELNEAREQQTATAEVLKVISRSTFDLQAVLDTLTKSAAQLCAADCGVIFMRDDDVYRLRANYGFSPEAEKYGLEHPIKPSRGNLTGRVALSGKAVHIPDVLADPEYTETGHQKTFGYRTNLGVPLTRQGTTIGVFSLTRGEVKPFTEKQIEVVATFADQAVIAIEKARLLNELRQRTTDLSESLEQQTATSEILKVISSSSGELESVFKTILANATQLCEAKFGVIFYYTDGTFHPAAELNTPKTHADFIRQRGSFLPAPGSTFDQLVRTKQVINLADAAQGPFSSNAAVKFGGARSQISVPMLKEDELIGAIAIYRQQVRPFTDKQIELVKNFAAQAVIAIENARLLNELRQRTTDLSESLEQLTATADVLGIISSSPGELEPVFSAMLESAARLCDAAFGNIFRWKDDALRLVATYNTPAAFIEARSKMPLRRDENNPIGGMLAAKTLLHVDALAADRRYIDRSDPNVIAAVELGGIRTFLAVPMLKDDELIGALIVYRQEVRPFSKKQIELVQNFAAQAVIAIENARLLNELKQRTADLSESLEQQTATSEVLKVISSSPGELEPVFEIMLQNAVRLCEATFGNVYRWDGDALYLAGTHNTPPALVEARRRSPYRPVGNTPFERVISAKKTLHIIDATADESYIQRLPSMVTGVELGGIRTFVEVPMLKEDQLIGIFTIFRQEVCPFTDKQISLLENFAAQAVIAIENARLLNELRQRTDEVVKLNQQLEQRVADQVGEIERMSRLRRFLPPQLADLIVASGTEKQLESHRREITALFCDLRGFTGFSESSDPEDVMALLAEYHGAIGESSSNTAARWSVMPATASW
jgi:GAF domain-containing protein